MTLSDAALTDLSTALDELGLTTDGGAQDARLERYIEAASAGVASYCNRTFERDDAITEKVAGNGRPRILLDRTPLLSITSITIDSSTVASDEYEIERALVGSIYKESLWPADASMGHWITKDPIAGSEDQNITVVYSGGYVTRKQNADGDFSAADVSVPLDLEDAVLQLVTSRWRAKGRDQAIKSQTLLGGAVAYGEGGAFSADVVRLLSRYRRLVGC